MWDVSDQVMCACCEADAAMLRVRLKVEVDGVTLSMRLRAVRVCCLRQETQGAPSLGKWNVYAEKARPIT